MLNFGLSAFDRVGILSLQGIYPRVQNPTISVRRGPEGIPGDVQGYNLKVPPFHQHQRLGAQR